MHTPGFSKIIIPSEHDSLMERAGGILTTFVDDNNHIKAAATSAVSEAMMRQHPPDKDHFGVLAIAMGCGEDYGWNKNGDWWTRRGLMKKHATFVTNGHFFREHLNQDPKYKIGDIKVSAYNKDMQRVELYIHGHKKLAEEEYELAKAGKQLSFSMSARVPEDYCSCCNNAAKRAALYCSHLKQSMTRWVPQFQKFAYAINDDPTFFDISRVRNPADRIAHYLEYHFGPDLQKAASVELPVLSSAMMAEVEGLPIISSESIARQIWLQKLADVESYVKAATHQPDNVAKDERYAFLKYSAAHAFRQNIVTDAQVQAMRSLEPDVLWRMLSKQAAVLPFFPFFAYVTGQSIKEAQADPVYHYAREHCVPNTFTNLKATTIDPKLEQMFAAGSQIKAACYTADEAVRSLVDTVADECSLAVPKLRSRISRNCLEPQTSSGVCKSASEVSPDQKSYAEIISQAYGLYKVAFCEAVSEMHGHDFIDDAALLLITSTY